MPPLRREADPPIEGVTSRTARPTAPAFLRTQLAGYLLVGLRGSSPSPSMEPSLPHAGRAAMTITILMTVLLLKMLLQ